MLVVIDMQNDFCDPAGLQARQGKDVSSIGDVVDRLTGLLAEARRAEVPVVHVMTTHDETTDTEEWLARHEDPSRAQSCRTGSWGAEFYGVRPEPGEAVIEKHRYNAFTATALDRTLRGLGRRSLLFCGVTTNTCVETSLRDAVCRDYLTTLVSDCCGSYTQEAHGRAVASVRSGFGLVTDSATIIEQWTTSKVG